MLIALAVVVPGGFIALGAWCLCRMAAKPVPQSPKPRLRDCGQCREFVIHRATVRFIHHLTHDHKLGYAVAQSVFKHIYGRKA